jgi:hypothetical protein
MVQMTGRGPTEGSFRVNTSSVYFILIFLFNIIFLQFPNRLLP